MRTKSKIISLCVALATCCFVVTGNSLPPDGWRSVLIYAKNTRHCDRHDGYGNHFLDYSHSYITYLHTAMPGGVDFYVNCASGPSGPYTKMAEHDAFDNGQTTYGAPYTDQFYVKHAECVEDVWDWLFAAQIHWAVPGIYNELPTIYPTLTTLTHEFQWKTPSQNYSGYYHFPYVDDY